MQTKRSYQDGCATAHAMDLIGERWALLVARELILGPKRFTDLRAGLPAISPNVLTQRLDELEAVSVVVRRKLPPPAATWVYELTPWGRELETVIMALGRWGARSPALAQGHPLSRDGLILSWRTMFSSARAGDLSGEIEIRMGDDRFLARLEDGHLQIDRGSAAAPDAVLEASPDTLAALAYSGRKLNEAVQAGALKVEGDKALLKRFLASFPLPEPAEDLSAGA
ncbi:winged helix-turn-helix transcriptional regulator [Niveibacterium sp. SC-1]|uniref:winged helix-turn-helix transcriptional regulator n=1 Tax=Niveibacterium sp. SC-1 TaxID=3135646 RepID=UPI00311F8D9B